MEIVAFHLPGTPIESITLAEKDIEAFPEVHSAVYVSEDWALARARAELVEFRDVLQELERNPLPASIEVKLKPKFRDAEHVNDVADRLRGFGFVDDVRFGRDWVEKLDRLRQIAAAVGLVVGAAFAVVAIIIIGTTIRMAVLQRSREIAIMRLVGATDGFIRRPFLLQGAIKGMLGGVAAIGLSYGAYVLINRWLLQVAFFSREQALAIVGFGMLIGLFGSAASGALHGCPRRTPSASRNDVEGVRRGQPWSAPGLPSTPLLNDSPRRRFGSGDSRRPRRPAPSALRSTAARGRRESPEPKRRRGESLRDRKSTRLNSSHTVI